jgi:NAD(P)-dependent dehydrogenase (short-subunit alcohol dehydrogenase family)
MSLYARFAGVGASGFGYGSTADEVLTGLDLSGRTYLVTGCASGLGAETMRALTGRGAKVIGAARSEAGATAACRPYGAAAEPLVCELSEPASVRAAVDRVRAHGVQLDGIVANAGIMALPKREVKYGCELQLLTNHVGHFLLVTGLLDRLTPSGRVVMLSSSAHTGTYAEGIRLEDFAAERGYSAWGAYGQSKLANLLFANHLQAHKLAPGQVANSVHPGVIVTNLGRHLPAPMRALFGTLGPLLVLKSPAQGAATQCYVAAHPAAAEVGGAYFADCNVAKCSAWGRDAGLAAGLWERTEAFVAGV